MITTDRELIKKSLLEMEDGELIFHSYTGYSGRKWTAAPMPNKATNWYLGVDRVTKEMKDSGKPYVDPSDQENRLSRFEITHGTRLDLSYEENRLILRWLVESDKLALSREEGEGYTNVLFYIYNRETAINTEAKKFETKAKAFELVSNFSDATLSMVARLLGYTLDEKSPREMRVMIQREADMNPEKIIRIATDKDMEIKDLMERLIQRGIISFDYKNKSYNYNQVVLATSKENLIFWLKEAQKKKNKEDFDMLQEMVVELN
jgi:hypothetical protein